MACPKNANGLKYLRIEPGDGTRYEYLYGKAPSGVGMNGIMVFDVNILHTGYVFTEGGAADPGYISEKFGKPWGYSDKPTYFNHTIEVHTAVVAAICGKRMWGKSPLQNEAYKEARIKIGLSH